MVAGFAGYSRKAEGRFPQSTCLINALTGQCFSAKNHLSGNATYQELEFAWTGVNGLVSDQSVANIRTTTDFEIHRRKHCDSV